MLNEASNNSEVMHVANFVLNEVPNSNDATHIEKYVCLTICVLIPWVHNKSQWWLYSHHVEKPTYQIREITTQ